MTLGAIHECERVEVYSKQAGGDWMFTYMDLKEIEQDATASVPEPSRRPPPKELVDLTGTDSGTLVLWSKYDRKTAPFQRLIEEFRVWAGRTYRYHIWDAVPPRSTPLRLEIQGVEVNAIDPLYARTEHTLFPDDPKAQVYDSIEIDWPVDPDVAEHEGEMQRITIKMSILPEEFRKKRGAGGSDESVRRHIPDNEGISILRSHREVFYGEIPYWKVGTVPGWPTFDDKDRWWGCEIHFEPALDRSFSVKNIKRGAVPELELKKLIKSKIKPTRDHVLREVKELWEETSAQEQIEARREQEAGVSRSGDHIEAEQIAKKTPTDRTKIDQGKDLDTEASLVASQMAERFNEEEQQGLAELFKSQPFTILEQSWRGLLFYEPKFLGGSSVLEYNIRHPFFAHINGRLEALESGEEDPAAVARELRVMLDLLIIAHARAEQSIDPDAPMEPAQTLEYLREDWGKYLHSYLRTYLKESASEGSQ